MNFRRIRIPSLKQFVISTAIVLVFYNEFFCFVVNRFWWPPIPTLEPGQSTELRALLVADPQLVGLQNEHPIFGTITRWDCDKFIRNGFHEAFNYVQPDVVIFLGDLFDEGSIATSNEFSSYIDRFDSVFKIPPHVQRIFLPGDNDVGGEGMEMKEPWKVNRFFQTFYRTNASADNSVVHANFVDFFKLSFDFGEAFAASMKSVIQKMIEQSTAPIRVFCNHMGILVRHPSEYSELISISRPSVFITAHTHEAAIYRCQECGKVLDSGNLELMPQRDTKSRGSITRVTNNSVFYLKLNDGEVIELVVPTCSYRMGVKNIGYGVAVFGSNKNLRYMVLWMQGRYTFLFLYVAYVIVTLLCLVIKTIIACCNGVRHVKVSKLLKTKLLSSF